MKRTSTFLLSIFSALSLQAQGTYLSTDFNRGIPAEYTTYDMDELPVKTGFKIAVDGNWFTEKIYGAQGRAAVSTSTNSFDLPVDNWLITPQLKIKSADAILTWDAKSVHYDLRDGYKIMISTTDNDPESFVELCSVKEESYTWQHHVLSLADYAGKKVYLAVLHDSKDKFLLAVDNIFVGEPAEPAFDAINNTRHFCGISTGSTRVEGKIRNIGKTTDVSEITCTSGLNVFTQKLENAQFKTTEQLDFAFDIPVTLDTEVPYQVDVKTGDGKTYRVVDDKIICSYFPRTLLVEKGTGVWCTACPNVMGYINELKEEYKDEVVIIESHTEYNDHAKLSYPIYARGMAASNYPIIYFNRNQAYSSYSKKEAEETLKKVIAESTPAKVEAEAWLEDGKIAVETKMSFGKDFDNANDKYRLGFAILQKHLQLPFAIQKNSISGAQFQEFGLLNSPFEPDFMFFHNIVKGTPSAFQGIPKSLPGNIQGDNNYTHKTFLDFPEGITSTEGITVVAFVLDYFNTRVLNTTEIEISPDHTGIHDITASTLEAEILMEGTACKVNLPNTLPFEVSVTDMSGRCIDQQSSNGNPLVLSTTSWGKGTYLVTVQQNGKATTQKVFAN